MQTLTHFVGRFGMNDLERQFGYPNFALADLLRQSKVHEGREGAVRISFQASETIVLPSNVPWHRILPVLFMNFPCIFNDLLK